MRFLECETSSGSRDPLGERAQIEFVQRLARRANRDRHQNRPRNAFETRVDLRESGFGVRDLPITANSAVNEASAQVDAEEQELAARRMFNEAYLRRMGRPQAFGLG